MCLRIAATRGKFRCRAAKKTGRACQVVEILVRLPESDMPYSRKISISFAAAIIAAGLILCGFQLNVNAQGNLTYPEINTALQTKLPNRSFKNKDELISWIAIQVRNRKVDKPLTKDREDDLRQAGATEALIQAIKANSPAVQVPRDTVVDLGELSGRAIDLVKPEYTPEARQAGTAGQVKLSLEIDTDGRVTSVSRLMTLPNGLTEQAIAAARQSRFTPARVDGKPARGTGILTYNFKINVLDPATVMTAAEDLRAKGDCDRAIPEYTRLIGINSSHSKAFFGRGMCYLIKANYDRAATDFDASASSDPDDAEAFFYLAVANDFKGETELAALNYGKAIRLRPEFGRRPVIECLYIDRRQMTPEQGRAAANDIIGACNQALRAAPEHVSSLIYMKRGIGHRLKSEYDKAIADFETARRLNPQITAVQFQLHTVYNSRGLEYFNKKEYKPAFDDISAAISMSPKSPVPYINRCVIYLYAWKQYDEAITDCTAAIRLSTKSATPYIHRGYAYEQKNSVDAAVADYKKALEIDPRNQVAQRSLSRVQRPSMKY